MQRTNHWDAVIAGGGAAGLSAAQMLARARRRVLVVDEGSPRNRFADHMHAVLGHDGRPPAQLLARGREELRRYGVSVAPGRVRDVSEVAGGLEVTTDAGPLSTRALIVATGITDELPAIDGLAAHWGRNVLHCPYCHGWEVRERSLGVLVTTPMGAHQAILLRQWTDRLTVVVTSPELLAEETRVALRARGVRVIDARISSVVEVDGRFAGLRTAEGEEIPMDAVFAGGIPRPHDEFLAGLELERTRGSRGEFIAVDAVGRTSHPRVWAVGNVVDGGAPVPYAMGAGTMAGANANVALVEEDTAAAIAALAEKENTGG